MRRRPRQYVGQGRIENWNELFAAASAAERQKRQDIAASQTVQHVHRYCFFVVEYTGRLGADWLSWL